MGHAQRHQSHHNSYVSGGDLHVAMVTRTNSYSKGESGRRATLNSILVRHAAGTSYNWIQLDFVDPGDRECIGVPAEWMEIVIRAG